MLIEDAVSSGTPQFVIDSYATLAERAKTQSFGLIEEDVIVLDTETRSFGAGLTSRSRSRRPVFRAARSSTVSDTFVHPKQLIPAEITELTSITNADVADARRPLRPSPLSPILSVVARGSHYNATFDRSFIESVKGGGQRGAIFGSIRWRCRESRFRAWPRTSCLYGRSVWL